MNFNRENQYPPYGNREENDWKDNRKLRAYYDFNSMFWLIGWSPPDWDRVPDYSRYCYTAGLQMKKSGGEWVTEGFPNRWVNTLFIVNFS